MTKLLSFKSLEYNFLFKRFIQLTFSIRCYFCFKIHNYMSVSYLLYLGILFTSYLNMHLTHMFIGALWETGLNAYHPRVAYALRTG
jgi:hypothetical protein